MASRTISDEDLLDKALGLFRTSGFEGVSLSDLSKATGLEKASLYYRYPGGKEEIALAVLQSVISWFEENVFLPLRTEDISVRERVTFVAARLYGFYGEGTKPCVFDVLSVPGGGAAIAETLKAAMQAWLQAFTGIALEGGFAPDEAERRAEEALITVEGALVLCRALQDPAAFRRAVDRLPELLVKK